MTYDYDADVTTMTAAKFYNMGWNVTKPHNASLSIGRCKWTFQNTALSLVLSITLILNALAAVVLFRVPLVTIRGRSNPVYLCIRFLNVADSLQAGLLLVMPALASRDCDWVGGDFCCRIMGFMALSLLLVSPVIAILMAFDRVIALYQPFKYRSHLGLKMLKVLLPLSCVFVVATTALPLGGVGEYHVVRGRRLCLLDTITDDPVDRAYVLTVHSLMLLALGFMAACSIAFQTKMTTMAFSRKHKPLSRSKTRERNRTRNATTTTMAVCCIFIVCYLPYVSRVLSETSSGEKSPTLVTWITFGLAFLQPMLNPAVYLLTNVRYKQELQILLRRIKQSDIEVSTGSLTGTSRGGFRRRFSSSAHRKESKHGCLKDKDLQESTTSPRTSGKIVVESGFSPSGKPQPKSSDNSDVFLNGNSECAAQICGSLERHHAESIVHRDQSSSSGIRSMDSTNLPASSQLQEHPARHLFGRLGPTSSTPNQSKRERSYTVCGRQSLTRAAASITVDLHESHRSASDPSLADASKQTKLEVATHEGEPLLKDHELITGYESQRTSTSSESCPAQIASTKVRHMDSDTSYKVIRCDGNVSKESAKRRTVSVTKKPTHRDSGMIDTSEPST